MRETVLSGSSLQDFLRPFRFLLHFSVTLLTFFASFPDVEAAITRTESSVGVILNATGDAKIRLVKTVEWLTAELDQDLLPGDGLRTGPLGTLALLFSDRTQVRIQRNSLITVKAVSGNGGSNATVLRLDLGGTWSRAVTGGRGVEIETPSATAAIRGTDWSITVDETGKTKLIVLDGEVVLSNPYGRVAVTRGEMAVADIGKAPVKTMIVNPKDREQQIYNLSLIPSSGFLFRVSSADIKERNAITARIEGKAPPARSAEDWLDLAEINFDLGDFEAARSAIAASKAAVGRENARSRLVEGYLACADYDFAGAEHLLSEAEKILSTDRILIARIGRIISLLSLRRSNEVETVIADMAITYGNDPRFLLFKTVLTAFAGDLPAAIEEVVSLETRFPNVPDFPALEGMLAILLDRPDQAKTAAKRAIDLAPNLPVGYLVLSEYLRTHSRDIEGAISCLQSGLSRNHRAGILWCSLGRNFYEIGEYRSAEAAYLRALQLNPKDVVCLANYAFLLLIQQRISEAETTIAEMEAIDPGRDFTKILSGRLALQKNDLERSKSDLLKATTLNPAYADALTILATTYYQGGEFPEAEQALANAERLNPNEPLIPLIGSIIASNTAHADEAITYAQKSIDLYSRQGGQGLLGLAAGRGGSTTLGAAFGTLGLNSWADYYNEFSFNPYSAESYFQRARRGIDGYTSVYMGLLMEPLATASRNRFIDYYRRPFTDGEVSESVGRVGNGVSHSESATLQGYIATPLPVSFYLRAGHEDSPGDRNHSNKSGNSFNGSIGVNLTPYDRLFLDTEGTFATTDLPGTTRLPDPDDEQEDKMIQFGIGYSHTFSARNIVLGRLMTLEQDYTFRNDDPLGSIFLSPLQYSLVYKLGVEPTRILYDYGLTDATDPAAPAEPLLIFSGPPPHLSGTFLDLVDPKNLYRANIKNQITAVDIRHLIGTDAIDITYGAEVISSRLNVDVDNVGLMPLGLGLIQGTTGSLPFVYGDPIRERMNADTDGIAGEAYAEAQWRINKKLTFSAGLFGNHAEAEGNTTVSRFNPRAGVAWQVGNHDWLRLVYRQDVAPAIPFSLSPSTTLGLMPDFTYLDEAGNTIAYIARWDREWSPHFFTAVELSRMDIDKCSIGAPDGLTFYTAQEARIDQAGFSANLWLKGGIGIFAQADLQRAADRSDGKSDRRLPLIPERLLTTGITWIHPRQIKMNLILHLFDDCPADDSNYHSLSGYETVDFTASWQPLDKHLELGLIATNLLNRGYRIGLDMPGSSRNVIFIAKWRF